MKTRKSSRWLALLLSVALILSDGICNHANAANSKKSYDMLSILFHMPYLDATGIEVYYQSERKELMQKMEELLATEPVHVTYRRGFSNYYAVTRNENSEYFYYGATKDNRPDGVGILTTEKVSIKDSSTFPYLVYAGGFSKGDYNGYGVRFANDLDTYKEYETYKEYTLVPGIGQMLVDKGIISKEMIPTLYVYSSAYVTWESTFKKGYATGKTNKFGLTVTLYPKNIPQNDYWGGSCYPNIILVSAAKNNQLSGNAKYYINGILRYDGEMKNGSYSGSGTSYFENGKVEYTGKWSYGYYHGQGTLYSEDGKVIYEGKWKKGDYAS